MGGIYEIMGVKSSPVESHPQLHLQQFATFMEFELAHFSHLRVFISRKARLFSLSHQKLFSLQSLQYSLCQYLLCFCTKAAAAAQSTQIAVFLPAPGTEGWRGNVLLDISAWLGALRLLPTASPSPGASWPGAAGARSVQGCVLQVGEDHACSTEYSLAANQVDYITHCII